VSTVPAHPLAEQARGDADPKSARVALPHESV
jgi:hypothetical protein